MAVVSRAQVLLFLAQAKKLIVQGKWCFVRRKKNLDALALIGWNETLLLELLCSLALENYVAGPEPDRDRPGEDVWTFGAEIEGEEYYIKLKLKSDRHLICLSFHRAEYRLQYPYVR